MADQRQHFVDILTYNHASYSVVVDHKRQWLGHEVGDMGRRGHGAGDALKVEFTIDELARAAGTTVRNVRAYQDRGLLPPPERRGRTGVYNGAHLARLRLIGGMLDRGYTLASIGELLDAWVAGRDIAQVMGLEAALTSPWSDEVAEYLSPLELMQKFQGRFTPEVMQRAIELEVIVPEHDRIKVPSPRLLSVGYELTQSGIPLEETLSIVALLRTNVEKAANELVQRVATYVFDMPYGHRLPPPEDASKLAEVIWRLRGQVDTAVAAEVARAMQRALDSILGDRLTSIYEHLYGQEPR